MASPVVDNKIDGICEESPSSVRSEDDTGSDLEGFIVDDDECETDAASSESDGASGGGGSGGGGGFVAEVVYEDSQGEESDVEGSEPLLSVYEQRWDHASTRLVEACCPDVDTDLVELITGIHNDLIKDLMVDTDRKPTKFKSVSDTVDIIRAEMKIRNARPDQFTKDVVRILTVDFKPERPVDVARAKRGADLTTLAILPPSSKRVRRERVAVYTASDDVIRDVLGSDTEEDGYDGFDPEPAASDGEYCGSSSSDNGYSSDSDCSDDEGSGGESVESD